MGEIDVREVGGDGLEPLVAVTNRVWPHTGWTVPNLLDWRRQAEDMLWLVASRGGDPAGAAVSLVGWHNPRHIGIARFVVLPEHRRRGLGTRLLNTLSTWLASRDATELDGEVREDDSEILAWMERRGFKEIGCSSILVLAFERVDPPPATDPPPGVEIIPWSERLELAPGMYEVAREATPDIPGNEGDDIGSLEEWLSRDMQGEADHPNATFVALSEGEVVGFAKLSFGSEKRAFHDLTGVRRSWRGKGIAGALKRKQIAWAKENGFERLETFNEERNEPIRRLNERHGYRVEPGVVVMRGPLVLRD